MAHPIPVPLPVIPDNIPSTLKGLNQWIVWRVKPNGKGGLSKIPSDPVTGQPMNPLDPANHMAFEEAFSSYRAQDFAGVGFVLTGRPVKYDADGNPLFLIGLDFDKVTENPETRDYSESVSDRLNSYMETSPSGKGVRMFALSHFATRSGQGNVAEIYSDKRFLTVTGQKAIGSVCEATEAITEIEAELFPRKKGKASASIVPFPITTPNLNRVLMGDSWPENEGNIYKIKEVLRYIPANSDYEIWRNCIWGIASLGWTCGQQVAEEWSATSVEHWQNDGGASAQDAIQSLFNAFSAERGVSVGSLFHYARENGMPAASKSDGFLQTNGVAGAGHQAFQLYTRKELDLLPPPRWTVRDVLPETGLAVIYGEPGSGKTFIALDLAAKISSGCADWFGHRLTKQRVIFAALEGSRGIQRRLKAWDLHNGKSADEVLVMLDDFNLMSEDAVTKLIDAVSADPVPGTVVFIDTLAQATAGADENSGQDMGIALQACKCIAGAVQGLVVLVHHTGKDAQRGMRGHSSLNGAADAALAVKRDTTKNTRHWRITKMKDGEDTAQALFDLNVIDLGPDEFAGRISSCAVDEIKGGTAPPASATPKPPQGKHAKSVLSALHADPKAQSGWSLAEAKDIAMRALPEVDSQYRATRADAALQSLTKGGYIQSNGTQIQLLTSPDHPSHAPL